MQGCIEEQNIDMWRAFLNLNIQADSFQSVVVRIYTSHETLGIYRTCLAVKCQNLNKARL